MAIARRSFRILRPTFLLLSVCIFGISAFSNAKEAAKSLSLPLLGASYPGWHTHDYADAEQHLAELEKIGFRLVSFVPTYSYPHLNTIDFSQGPDWGDYSKAVTAALRQGFTVVLKPHLDPAIYNSNFDASTTDNDSWRTQVLWRGFFDVDPMCDDYREKLIGRTLAMLQETFEQLGTKNPKGGRWPPVRLELGTELMNAVVYHPERWAMLLSWSRQEVERRGLKGRVLLSHNFTHHFQLPEDFVLRMTTAQREDLARYIKGLDALALSQYMDLTIAVPEADRASRLPTSGEIARALTLHDKNFIDNILKGQLKLKNREIPPVHIGEFGIGIGGLRHPNVWDVKGFFDNQYYPPSPSLVRQIVLGLQGLCDYLNLKKGRLARDAVLWTTGPEFDIFGWGSPKYAIPEAANAVRQCLSRP